MLFDSHCHLTDERFAGDLDDVVGRARAAGVTRLATVASDLDDAERACEVAARFDGVWATVGIHPHMAEQAGQDAFARLLDLAARPEVVALGETGLDYHYEHSPREAQRRSFRRHLELAREKGLPVVVHSRKADDDTIALLREAAAEVRGVLHCFDGGPALLEAALEAGWFISFSGLVTFRNYAGAELVRAVPADRLLVETDSPYLAPVPHRGKRNEPAFVGLVAEALARLRGEPLEAVARATTRNACELYRLAE